MLYYFKKGKDTTKTHKKNCALFGEGAVTSLIWQKWFAKFSARGFYLDNAPWSSRSTEVDSD